MAEIACQPTQVLTITNPAPNLDPIDVIFLDHKPGAGRIVVRVYSQAWTAWFVCTEWRARDRVFALTSGARNLHRTDVEALKGLIARKKRQLVILNSQKVAAEDTLGIALETLPKLEAYRASGRDRP